MSSFTDTEEEGDPTRSCHLSAGQDGSPDAKNQEEEPEVREESPISISRASTRLSTSSFFITRIALSS